MKVCFAGLGSIASRHIRNMKALCKQVEITVLRSGKGSMASDEIKPYIDKVCTDIRELDRQYDAVFITNPTACHYKTLESMLIYSNVFFIEKPVFFSGEEDISQFLGLGKIFYVACPLRYTKPISYLKENIDFSKVYSIRAICSSYLPDWRSEVDYRNSYSAHKDMGGGVSVDLVHEWDYLQYLLGFPNLVKSFICTKSDLQIDSDDVAIYIAEYEGKVVELHIDYFGRQPIRQLELFTRDDTIHVDLYKSKISWLKAGKQIQFKEKRDDYQTAELRHFLRIVGGLDRNDNDLETACRVLRIARGGI